MPCLICSDDRAQTTQPDTSRLIVQVDCPQCGTYTATSTVKLAGYEGRDRELLMGEIRNRTERGAGPVELTTVTTQQVIDQARPPRNPNDAVDLLLEHAARRSERPGHRFAFRADDLPLLYTNDPREFEYYVQYARDCGFLHAVTQGYRELTPAAWQRLDELRRTGAQPDQAFVAMWFDADLEDAWSNGFYPALDEAGYDPLRIDLQEHNEKICDRIVAEIRRSGLLVADFTGHRGGVYFEAGFAMGLGIPVIWTCREGDIDGAHFDTRQYNHVVWSDPDDLKERLLNRVRATAPLQAD